MPWPPTCGLPRYVSRAMRRGRSSAVIEGEASLFLDRSVKRATPGSEQVADRVDEQPGEAADHGAVDADELEVPADLQLDAPGGLVRVPPLDRRGDEVAHLPARLLHHLPHRRADPLVDLRLQLRVVPEPLPEGDDPGL